MVNGELKSRWKKVAALNVLNFHAGFFLENERDDRSTVHTDTVLSADQRSNSKDAR